MDALSQVTAEELKGIEGATVVDVRKSGEYLSEHLIDAIHVELDYINDQMASVPQEGTFYVHCAGGYRSVIASSILKARGYHNMVDVAGGFKAIKEAGLKVSDTFARQPCKIIATTAAVFTSAVYMYSP